MNAEKEYQEALKDVISIQGETFSDWDEDTQRELVALFINKQERHAYEVLEDIDPLLFTDYIREGDLLTIGALVYYGIKAWCKKAIETDIDDNVLQAYSLGEEVL